MFVWNEMQCASTLHRNKRRRQKRLSDTEGTEAARSTINRSITQSRDIPFHGTYKEAATHFA